MKKTLYIAGPITGMPAGNRFVFNHAAARLIEHGYDIVNPHTLVPEPAPSWEECMKICIPHMLKCDGVALLSGWHSSKGAKEEDRLAALVGIPSHPIAWWLE